MIHPTAIVHPAAELAREIEVGPGCVIGARVRIAAGTRLLAHVVVDGPTSIGARVVVHPFAVLGGAPQDRSYVGEPTELVIADDVVIREHVTLHRGTSKDRAVTRVGARTLLMVGVHVAHDVEVGEECTIANGVQLAGHVTLEEGVTIGGGASLAPFVRVGEAAFVAARAGVEQDVPPFHIVQGDRAHVRALNVVGLERRGVPRESIDALAHAHRAIYRSGAPIEVALRTLDLDDDRVRRLVEFLRSHTTTPGPR